MLMDKGLRQQMVREILDATNGGDALSDDDVNDLCYMSKTTSYSSYEVERLARLHDLVLSGKYPNQSLFGLEHLRRDANGTVFYKGIRVAISHHRFLMSKQAEPVLRRLHNWCVKREAGGEKISYAAAMMEDFEKSPPTKGPAGKKTKERLGDGRDRL